ncbi:Spermatogenesis-Associated Protein 3 [Manis pentadactyla]|nr:Spermatogenesis-Associated Protein 3 [Manis pentadactyla]
MQNGKRKKPEARRHGSTSQSTSSESTPQQQTSETSPQPSIAEPRLQKPASRSTLQQPASGSTLQQPASRSTLQQPASGSTLQEPASGSTLQQPASGSTIQQSPPRSTPKTSSESAAQPIPESIPKQPVFRAPPATKVSRSTQGLSSQDTHMKATPHSKKTGSLTRAGLHICSCSTWPSSFTCWHRLGLCHSCIFDVLLPRAWPAMPGRGLPNLLTFYRKPTRKHSSHHNSHAPSPGDCCCGSRVPGSCLLHH